MASPIRSGGIRAIRTLVAPTPSPQVDPNALTPEEIAEFEAKEKVALATPAPVEPTSVVTAAPPVAVAPISQPAPSPNALTPEEIAEFEAKEKAAAPVGPRVVNPVTDLTADELAEFSVKDPTFVLDQEFKKGLPARLGAFGKRRNDATLAESQEYNALKEKFALADHAIRERGFQLEDIPGGLKQAPGMIADLVTGFGKYVKPFLSSAAGADVDPAQRAENQRGILEAAAATEASLTGLGQLGKQTAGKIARGVGNSKPLSEFTLDEKVKAFDDKLKQGETQEAILRGQGPVMQAFGQEAILQTEAAGLPIRPEEVAAKSAGDPFALYAFGKAFGPVGRVVGKIVPEPIKALGRQAMAKAETLMPEAVGGALKYGSKVVSGPAKFVEKVAPTVGAVVGAVKGAQLGGPLGIVPGAGAGLLGGKAVASGAKTVAGVAEKVAGLGEQVSGAKPMVSSYAQLVRSASEALPSAVVGAAEGLAMDIGLAAVSSESPQDTQGAINIGTALGAGKGLAVMSQKLVSGQIVAPRSYGVDRPVTSSRAANPAFVEMHNEAFRALDPAARANVNATRKFMQDAVPDSDFFLAKDAATVETKLVEAGVTPERAKQLAKTKGFFTVDLPGKDGTPRRTVIARDVAAAPHESFHVIQDVLGEPANRALDELVKREYGDQWDAQGQSYADRLGENPTGRSWEEIILDRTGWGRVELIDKMTRELTASNEAQGGPTNPEFIRNLVAGEIARLEAKKGGDLQNIWNGELSAEEAKTVADRYVARELAAENFDAAFKNRGIALQEGTSLPQRMARVLAGVISGLGGNPLQGVTTEIGRIEPRMGVMEAVSEAGRARLPMVEPGVTPRPRGGAPPVAPRPGAPGQGVPVTPEQITTAATEAQQVAAAAPDVVLPGASASPRELLGTVAEAIATRSGVKINYRSAPGEPAAATTSNRTARRAVVEAFRSMPQSARALWEKNFFPERVIALKDNKYQVMGWSPEAFAANAHKLAKALIDTRKGDFAPYPLDPATGSFTAEGWQRLYDDTQVFVENQAAGRTGAGEELVVPRSVIEAGGYKPPVTGPGTPLGQTEADFINVLFGFKLPDTPRMQKGRRPLNIVGQEVSEATLPGRTGVPTRPREAFSGQEATAQGLVGREILEVNPTRGMLERALGEQMPSLIEAIQRLNLESINDVAITPEQPQFRANTLTVTAGFQPRAPRGKGYAADEMWLGRDKLNSAPDGHKKWAETNFPEGEFDPTKPQLDPYERAQQGGYLRVLKGMGTLMVDASPKYPSWDKVPRGFKNALESRAVDQDLRVTFDGREVIGKFRPGEGGAQFQPSTLQEQLQNRPVKDIIPEIIQLPTTDWMNLVSDYKGKYTGGLTGLAIDLGAHAKTTDDLVKFKENYSQMYALGKMSLEAGDFTKAMEYSGRSQLAREAYEAATGRTFDGTQEATVSFIRSRFDPDYQPPMPTTKPIETLVQDKE